MKDKKKINLFIFILRKNRRDLVEKILNVFYIMRKLENIFFKVSNIKPTSLFNEEEGENKLHSTITIGNGVCDFILY